MPDEVTSARQRFRRLCLLVHGWIGLTAGAVMALFGSTGALLVVSPFLLQWELGRDYFPGKAQFGLAPGKIDAFIKAARDQNPSIASLDGVYAAHATPVPSTAVLVIAHVPDASGEERHFVVPVHPGTAEARPGVLYESTWTGFILSLHMGLVPVGYAIFAGCGVLFLFSSLAGLFLWWPFKNRWRAALPAPANASLRARWLSWHNFAGVWLLLPLVVVVFTGIWMLKPSWVEPVAALASKLSPQPDLELLKKRIAADGGPELPLGKIAQRALDDHPGHVLASVTAPHEPHDPVTIGLLPANSTEPRRQGSVLWLHPATGETLAAVSESNFSVGDTVKAWLRPIHADLGLGLVGATIVFLGGLSLPALYVTGVFLWWQRTRGCRRGPGAPTENLPAESEPAVLPLKQQLQ